MSQSTQEIDRNLTDILGEAKAIRFALQYGALSYNDAKKRVQPLLNKINAVGKVIARKYKRKYRKIRFQDL